MSKRGFLKKIADFIGKDTTSKNESKKLVVVIRFLILSVIVYFIFEALMCTAAFHVKGMLFYLAFTAAFTGIFAMSYKSGTKPVLWMFNLGTIIWVCIIVHYFGWNIGVQHFLMVLLVLYFFSGYKQYTGKIVFAVALCGFRILLFYLYQDADAIWKLSPAAENAYQIVNTITIFWCISVVAYVFSVDTQEMEGKLVDYNNQLKVQAATDTLTGLPNRRKAEEYLNAALQEQQTFVGFSLCICDIDYFKRVNDQYGHDVGDEVLREIARIFKEEVRDGDFAARWGGEEFLLLFPECNGDIAFMKLDRMRRRINAFRFKKDDMDFGITMTFGLAEYDFKNGLQATIKEADEKLYLGKEQGRDRIIF